jgi:hypothetical protein
MDAQAENILALRQLLPDPCLGIQPYCEEGSPIATDWLDSVALNWATSK